jgi:hypothetical protein
MLFRKNNGPLIRTLLVVVHRLPDEEERSGNRGNGQVLDLALNVYVHVESGASAN